MGFATTSTVKAIQTAIPDLLIIEPKVFGDERGFLFESFNRRSSPTFEQHVALGLSAENKRMFWIPEGFAHGFVVLSDTAEYLYKTTDYWLPEYERCIRWDDPVLAIVWKPQATPALSGKDAQGRAFAEAELFA